MNKFFMLTSIVALVACNGKDDSGDADAGTGTEWCGDYLAALDSCYGEAGFSLSDYGLDDTFCDAYEGVTDTATRDFFSCYNDAIEAGDCSTEAGIEAMGAEAATCTS
jgi:hypothetical protein